MNRISINKIISLVTLLIACAACNSTKQLQTQATEACITHSAGQLDNVIQFMNMHESWIVPVERNGAVTYDTIRHQIDINDTIHHRVNVTDTVHSQVLQEQTKGKVKTKQKGLADVLRNETHEQDTTGVWLIISVGFNVLFILVIIIVISLNKNRLNKLS